MTTTRNSTPPNPPALGDTEWLSSLPPAVKTMWDNVCQSMDAGLFTMVGAGARTIIERVAQDRIRDVEQFPGKLDALEREGFISRRQKHYLAVVVEAGNATLHRQLELDGKQASVLLRIIEALLRITYLPEESVNALKDAIPPRRRRTGH